MSQTPNINMYITDTSDARVSVLSFSPVPGQASAAIPLRLHNGEAVQGTAANVLNAIRADLLRSAPAVEETFESNANGQELVSEAWLEIKPTAGTWTPIDEDPTGANKVDLGAIAAGAFAAFEVRLNVASGAASISEVSFCLAIRSRP